MPSVSQIGKLKNQITIQNTDLTTDTYGGYTKANSSFVTAWASIRPKTGKEIHTPINLKLGIVLILLLA